MSDFAEFDKYCDEHPDIEPHIAFAQYLSDVTGETVVGRQQEGDGLVIAVPDADPEDRP